MPELDDSTKAKDAAEITVDSELPRTRKRYRVTALGGLYKNGNKIDAGQVIELDDRTAANFMRENEIELEEGGKSE